MIWILSLFCILIPIWMNKIPIILIIGLKSSFIVTKRDEETVRSIRSCLPT